VKTLTLVDAPTTAETDAADIRAILGAISAAYRDKDAEAIERHYVPGARITDLAPPLLRRGFDAAAVQTWLDGWDGLVKIATRDLVVEVDDALAVAHGLQHVAARTRGRRGGHLAVADHPNLRPHASGLADHPRA
jgi:ketosteroid isomerase-like protein